MEDFDNAKTRNPKECVVTNLNSYLTYISDIKETIKKEEGAEVSTKHYFFRGQASNEWNVMPGVFRDRKSTRLNSSHPSSSRMPSSA